MLIVLQRVVVLQQGLSLLQSDLPDVESVRHVVELSLEPGPLPLFFHLPDLLDQGPEDSFFNEIGPPGLVAPLHPYSL